MAPNINSRLMVKVPMQKTLYTQPGYSVHMEYRSGHAIVLYHRGLTLNAELLDGGLGVWRGCTGEHSPRATGPTGYASSAICIRSIGLENRSTGRPSSREPKKLWTTFNDLLGCRSGSLGQQTPSPFSADAFLEKLAAKVSSIREATSAAPPPDYPPTSHRLSTLREVTNAELRMLIVTLAPKTCELDPVPTFLVQEHIDVILPFLTVLCNSSIREAQLPSSQKQCILHPVLKREGLDPSDPAN